MPIGKVAPGKCDFVQTILPEVVQLSLAVGSVQLAVPVHNPVVLATVTLEGQPLIIGF